MAEPIDARERRELCDLMIELGPDAPTLCEGWTSFDLTAHLVLREHFKRWGDERMSQEKAQGFGTLVGRLRAGAPLVPWRLPKARTLLNGLEYFIHHEDLRRANGLTRRTDRPDLDDLAWSAVGLTGRGLARKIRPYGLEISRPGGSSRQFGKAPRATLIGEPSEIVLYLSGRRDAAEVRVEGDPAAVAVLRDTESGL
jgi:uncharacterized protein (TIGR03085 family)